jgi:riboflavin synthase
MFTGLIEDVGTVSSITPRGDAVDFVIEASTVLDDISVDASIATNGVCLTVTSFDARHFSVTAVAETLRKTSLGHLRPGSLVNLERAVRLSDRLGGHLVQGHVDTTGSIKRIDHLSTGWEMYIAFPPAYRKWLIPVGSVCVDGISLTVADVADESFKVAIIPHTLDNTSLRTRSEGDIVNLEFDMIAKYIDNLIKHP